VAFALVANVEAVPGANGGTSAGIDTTGASLLIIHGATFASATGVSDSKGNTWTALTEHSRSQRFSRIWYVTNPTVGAGHTFTISGTGIYPHLAAAAFSGADTASPFDQENGANAAAATSIQTGSVTPTTNDQLIIAGVVGFDTNAPTINLSFTTTDTEATDGSTKMMGGLAYLIQTSAAAVNPTWSWVGSDPSAASIATFKAAAGGGGGTTFKGLTLLGVGA
jgi:hypothetical protein